MKSLPYVPTQGTLRRVLKKAVFGDRICCPKCHSRSIYMIIREERWRCRRCHKPFSLKSSSWLKGSKLSLETIWFLLVAWQKKLSVQQTADFADVSIPTVSAWYQKFRNHVPKERLAVILSDAVAVDEMFTRHNCIMGAKQKGTRKVAFKVLHGEHPNKTHAVNFLQAVVKAESRLHTDGSGIYRGIENWHKLKHTYEIHKKWEFSLTAEIEGVWGCFRTFVRRMYHHVTRYKLEELVAEFALRFSQDVIFRSPEDYWRICLSPKPFAL